MVPQVFLGKRYEKNGGFMENGRDFKRWDAVEPPVFTVFWAVDELSTRLDHVDPAVSNSVVQ